MLGSLSLRQPWHGTTVGGTNVRTRAEHTQGKPLVIVIDSLANQFTDHPNESGMRTHGRGAHRTHAQLSAQVPCLCVQIKKNLHVIRHKTDRRDDNI